MPAKATRNISRSRCKQKRRSLSMSPPFPRKRSGLHDANVEAKFHLRQGLWIEDLRIPPGQECSNGSLILFAVVLWRTFSGTARPPGVPVTAEP
jgi:hypothetical protein